MLIVINGVRGQRKVVVRAQMRRMDHSVVKEMELMTTVTLMLDNQPGLLRKGKL